MQWSSSSFIYHLWTLYSSCYPLTSFSSLSAWTSNSALLTLKWSSLFRSSMSSSLWLIFSFLNKEIRNTIYILILSLKSFPSLPIPIFLSLTFLSQDCFVFSWSLKLLNLIICVPLFLILKFFNGNSLKIVKVVSL